MVNCTVNNVEIFQRSVWRASRTALNEPLPHIVSASLVDGGPRYLAYSTIIRIASKTTTNTRFLLTTMGESSEDELPESIYSSYEKDPSVPVDYLFRFLPKDLRSRIVKSLTPDEKRALNQKQTECQSRIVDFVKDMIKEFTEFAENQVDVASQRSAVVVSGAGFEVPGGDQGLPPRSEDRSPIVRDAAFINRNAVNLAGTEGSVAIGVAPSDKGISTSTSEPSTNEAVAAATAAAVTASSLPSTTASSVSSTPSVSRVASPTTFRKPALKRTSSVTRKGLLHDENDKRHVVFNPETQVTVFHKEDDSSRECSEDEDEDEPEVITDEAHMLPWIEPNTQDEGSKKAPSPSMTTSYSSQSSGDVSIDTGGLTQEAHLPNQDIEPIQAEESGTEDEDYEYESRDTQFGTEADDSDNIFAFDEALDDGSNSSSQPFNNNILPQQTDPTARPPDVLRRALLEQAPSLVSSLPTYRQYETLPLPQPPQTHPRYLDEDSPSNSVWSSMSSSPINNGASMYASSLPIDITFHNKPTAMIRKKVEEAQTERVLTGSPRALEDADPNEFPLEERDITAESLAIKDMDPGRMSFSQRMLWEETTAHRT